MRTDVSADGPDGVLPPGDYDPEVLKQAVNDAVANIPVPADGKSITPDDVRPMLEQMVKEAVSHIPAPRR